MPSANLNIGLRHRVEWVDGGKGYYCTQQLYLGDSRLRVNVFNAWVKAIKSSCLVKGQSKITFLVKNQSKYQVGQHFNQGRRLEYRIYRSVTPLF